MRLEKTMCFLALGSVITSANIQANSASPGGIHSLDKVVVTSTREEKPVSEIAESIGVLSREEIQNVSPSHPSEILNRTAGVYINNLGGEGHMTAIRQPITTSGVYLFLEDGIPTRPTGFFNHNGLYEVNIPQSERLEVTKGPGSALYGSDAIGGIINSISAQIPEDSKTSFDTETGSYGWQRFLVSSGRQLNTYSGASISANVTQNEGFRDDANYERASLNGRYHHQLTPSLSSKTTISYTQVDQSGVSGLEFEDYKNDIEKNEYRGDVGAREIEALRVSSEFALTSSSNTLITVTPFYRKNRSDMMPSWMVTYDANTRETKFESFGLLSKWRQNLTSNSQIISGLDVDYTPSTYEEFEVTVEKEGDFYNDFEKTGTLNYHYDANQTSISPYIHYEQAVTPQVRLSAGLRYDMFKVDYTNQLDVVENTSRTQSHIRPESQDIDYEHLSPKAGVIIKLTEQSDIYSNYRHGFRAPSIGTLFRSGSSANTPELKPVKTDSIEVGLRGISQVALGYYVAIYYMEKTDDIVSAINSDSERISLNAGKTIHQGIELGLNGSFTQSVSFNISASYSEQTYGKFEYLYNCYSCSPRVVNEVLNFDGNDVGKAPNTLGNIAIRYEPLAMSGFMTELEMEHVGDYYTDETNTNEYSGHELLNLRSRYQINQQVELYGRLQNILDKRYSTYTSNQVGSEDISYRPGQPFTVFAGLRAYF